MAAPAPAPIITIAPPQTPPPAETRAPVPRKSFHLRRWSRIALILALACFAPDYVISALLHYGWQNQRLTRKLDAAFGRPVEVGNYSFSLLEGPRLEANRITVGEDTRFGHEYFLSADQLAVGLRWSALLRGRIELGTLSLTNPRLNLVRLPDGEWNLVSWLPLPPGNLASASVAGRGTVRLEQINISNGRLDIKQGPDKLPFAFVNVDGRVEQAVPGRWRIDLKAQPFRAAAGLQQAGEIRLSGVVGGTSSRLRPAALRLDWYDASLPDVLRLVRGNDYGIRGQVTVQLTAQTAGMAWNFASHAQFRELHRWDLPPRAGDPAANLNLQARWLPGAHRLELAQAVIETPHSNLHATGGFAWGFDPETSRLMPTDSRLELLSSGLQLNDLFTWYRAFHSGVPEQLGLRGIAGVNLTVTGWPPRIEEGSIATEGFSLGVPGMPGLIRAGHASLEFSPRMISLPAVAVMTGDNAGNFRVQGTVDRRVISRSDWRLDSRCKDVSALLSSAAALGFQFPQGWAIAGPAQAHLEWKGVARPRIPATRGTIALAGLKIRAPFLNGVIEQVRGTIKLSPNDKRIQLASVDAFSGNWSGTIERRGGIGDWQFELTANALDAAELDRWLNPQRRDSFLELILPFLAPAQQKPAQVPAWLNGRGTLSLGQFRLAPLTFQDLRAEAAIAGRTLEFSHAKAKLHGGLVNGSIELKLNRQPSYSVNAEFRNVNLSELAGRTFSLADRFGGTASGKIEISATGLGRAALLHSLTCDGAAQIQQASYQGLDLFASLQAGESRPGSTAVPQAFAKFSCGDGRIHFSHLQLLAPNGHYEVTGDVSYQRQLHLELRQVLPESVKVAQTVREDASPVYLLTGPLNAPKLFSTVPHLPSK